MTTRLLIPVDGSAGSLKAVEYVAETFGRTPDMEFVLLHILPKLPPSMWDDGHILTESEQKEREAVIEDWKEQEGKPWETMINEAREKLLQNGVPAEALTVKYEPTYSDVADDIPWISRRRKYLSQSRRTQKTRLKKPLKRLKMIITLR